MGLFSSWATPAVSVPTALQLVRLDEHLLAAGELAHHRVQGRREVGELVPVPAGGLHGREVALGDPPGGGDEAGEGAHHLPGEEVRDDDGEDEKGGEKDEGQPS